MIGKTIYVYSAHIQSVVKEPVEAVVAKCNKNSISADKVSTPSRRYRYYYRYLSKEEGKVCRNVFWLYEDDPDKAMEIIKQFQRERLVEMERRFAIEKQKILNFIGEK